MEDQVKTLNERNKSFNLICVKLIRKSLDYLKQIKELEEDKKKNIMGIAKRPGGLPPPPLWGTMLDQLGLAFRHGFGVTTNSGFTDGVGCLLPFEGKGGLVAL